MHLFASGASLPVARQEPSAQGEHHDCDVAFAEVLKVPRGQVVSAEDWSGQNLPAAQLAQLPRPPAVAEAPYFPTGQGTGAVEPATQ